MSNITKWMEVYERHLRDAVGKYPDEYAFSLSDVPLVLARMKVAFFSNSFNKEGRAIKATANELGVKYTYKGIREFIHGGT